jgi:hypothetical protein
MMRRRTDPRRSEPNVLLCSGSSWRLAIGITIAIATILVDARSLSFLPACCHRESNRFRYHQSACDVPLVHAIHICVGVCIHTYIHTYTHMNKVDGWIYMCVCLCSLHPHIHTYIQWADALVFICLFTCCWRCCRSCCRRVPLMGMGDDASCAACICGCGCGGGGLWCVRGRVCVCV